MITHLFFLFSVPSYSRRHRISLGKTTRCRRVLALQQAVPAPFPWHESENADLTPRDKRGGVHLAPTRRHCKSEARFHSNKFLESLPISAPVASISGMD